MSKQVNTDVVIVENKDFLNKAEEYKCKLQTEVVYPEYVVTFKQDNNAIHNIGIDEIIEFTGSTKPLDNGDEVIFDFGSHIVGNFEFDIESVGSPADAPLLIEVRYGEMPIEIEADYDKYDGWISKSWLQDEKYHIDVLPHSFNSNRRNSFRYVRIKVVATSEKYKVVFNKVRGNYTSAVDKCDTPVNTDKKLEKISEVSIRTLKNCMQDVFEDGPKRDRRLWLGDLYLQAQANYHSFNNLDLVKRCLYLFAAIPDNKGRVCANLFVKPYLIPDDTYLFDYSLHFINTLHDYYEYTNDKDVLIELYETAKNQIVFADEHVNSNSLVEERDYWWSFFDWQDDLNKATSAHGLYMFTLKNMIKLAKVVDPQYVNELEAKYNNLKKAAIEYLFDSEEQLFVCDKQISMHSQVWMILGGVVNSEEGARLLKSALSHEEILMPVTPFAQHFLVLAYLKCDMKEEATKLIKDYWGAMVDYGADTFWELFDPHNIEFSPYGSHLANSYCHAWSCTPVYLIDKYNL